MGEINRLLCLIILTAVVPAFVDAIKKEFGYGLSRIVFGTFTTAFICAMFQEIMIVAIAAFKSL